MVLDGRQDGELRRLLPAAAAFQAGREPLDAGVAVHLADLDPAQRPRGVAVGALDLQGTAEADEIAGGVDMLVGHFLAI